MQAAICVRRFLDVFSLSSRIKLTAAPASSVDDKALSPSAATIHTPAFKRSPQVSSAYVQSIPYVRRIALYVEVLRALDTSPSMNEEQRAGVLRANLFADLACELRLKKRNHKLTEACFKLLLPRPNAFCEIDLPCLWNPREDNTSWLFWQTWKRTWHLNPPGIKGFSLAMVLPMSPRCPIIWLMVLCLVFFSPNLLQRSMLQPLHPRPWKIGRKTWSQRKNFSRGIQNQSIILIGRAFASLLGSVACRENKWSDNPNNPVSIAGSVCTEFSMLSTPESITLNRDTMKVANNSIERKATIASRSTLNRRFISDFTSNENVNSSVGLSLRQWVSSDSNCQWMTSV